jgi:hypothetical protein
MSVRFSAFDEWYEIDSIFEGSFLERTSPGSFERTIREDGAGVKVLYDHGFDPQIGNKVLGSITSLREEADSPVGEVQLYDTSYNRDLLPGLADGAYGSSFRFRVTGEEWNDEPERSDHNPKGLPERTIKEVRLMEFGPVTFPANRSSTASVEPRSLTDTYYSEVAKRDVRAYEDVCRAAGKTPTDFTGRTDARSAVGGDGDAEGKSPDASTSKARRARELAWRTRTRL